VLNLEALLALRALTQEIEQDFRRDRGLKERAQFGLHPGIGRVVNAGFGIDGVHPAGVVCHDGNLLILQRAARLGGQLRAVEPHGLGNEPPVVGQDAFIDINKVLGVQRGGYQKNVIQRNSAQDVQRRGVQGGERDTFARALVFVAGLVAESIHGLDRFRFPVRDGIRGIFLKAEMPADVQIKIELVAFVAEERVAFGNGFRREKWRETIQLALLRGQAPGFEVEIEHIMIHDVLLQAQDAAVRSQLGEIGKPRVFPPLPDQWRHQVGQHQRIHQAGEHKDFHVGESVRGRDFFEPLRRHAGYGTLIHGGQDTAQPRRSFKLYCSSYNALT